MDAVTLPVGFSSRAPRLDDAGQIHELVSAYNSAVVEMADCTLDDVVDELTEPGFVPNTDAWLVLDRAATPAGYATARVSGVDQLVEVDVLSPEPAIGRWLFDRVLARAVGIGRAHGLARVPVHCGVYRADGPLRALVAGLGFRPATTYHRMRIDHPTAVASPALPRGVRLRTVRSHEPTRRAAYGVMAAAFRDHFGHAETGYEQWRAVRDSRSAYDWSQLDVLELDAVPVGVCERTDQFVEAEDCGYVAALGVLPAARGRGLARFLLRRAFALDAAAGRAGTLLHVDTNNTTPALDLYLGVGMRPALVIDVWGLELPVGR